MNVVFDMDGCMCTFDSVIDAFWFIEDVDTAKYLELLVFPHCGKFCINTRLTYSIRTSVPTITLPIRTAAHDLSLTRLRYPAHPALRRRQTLHA